MRPKLTRDRYRSRLVGTNLKGKIMKLLLSVCAFAASVSSFALPIRPAEAIAGLQKTASFEKASKLAVNTLNYYDKLEVTSGSQEGEAICYPSGAKSKSSTVAKVVFTNTTDALKITKYFATPEQAKDFSACN